MTINKPTDEPTTDLLNKIRVRKISGGKWSDQTLSVVREMPVTIFLNNKEIVTLLCTGTHLKALAVGFLAFEGLIAKREDIEDIVVDDQKGLVKVTVTSDPAMEKSLLFKRIITSGCGKGTIFYHAIDSLLTHRIESPLSVASDQIFLLMSRINAQSVLYKKSRGVHNTALATLEEVILFESDIGRHNAVDMIYGTCVLELIPLEDKILLTTGRVTSEVLLKAGKMRVPILVSRNVATQHALTLAHDIGITVIGDVRGNKFVVYTHPERIKG
ncbi:MAG: formate dehydrogenase accessory sulfurtransferase FdhD [Deltaproteobacteria bacterium]|nr:formate dehydrogenase accessory sulfurtransferase FdhD [Deltaproteobacteria bacterium]